MPNNEILIIEDNNTMRFAMSETLQREGYSVSDFTDPVKAIEFFNKKPLELVITDD